MKKTISLLVVVCLLAAFGCGRKVSLSGKVSFADDGSPLPAGTVCFVTDDSIARGVIRPDGSYVVGSDSLKDGLLPGTYRVYVSGATRYTGEMRDDMPVSEDLIAEKYLNAETSGLEYEVTPSSRRFDFQVERP